MNVFTITQRSINFFINICNYDNSIENYVKTEYKPVDWQWAYKKLKLESKKN